MNTEISNTPPAPLPSLDELLKCAVVLNWDALTQGATSGRVRVEYHIGADGALEHLKLWNTAREYWSLICECSTNPRMLDGPRFSNGYHSRPLARLLQTIFVNPSLCTHARGPNANTILDIDPPADEEVEAAKLRIAEAFPPPAPVRSKKQTSEAQLVPKEAQL